MKSTNANDGTMTLKVSFEVGSDLDMSNVLTQNRVSEGMPQMPQSVKNYGVSVKKALAFPLLVISIKSPNGTYDSAFLSNYTTINVNDAIARIQGVGQINLFGGSDYAMRVWLRPDVIGRLGLTVPDIVNAINQQNQLTPAGQIGGPPATTGTQYTYTVRTQGRLLNEEEFSNIIVRTNPDGSEVRLKDIARLELGTMLYNSIGRHDGTPSAVIAVFQIPGTNALDVANRIKATMADLSTRFPRDMEYLISLDTTLPDHRRHRRRSSTRCSKPSGWSSSWSSSSCRTGAPPSFPCSRSRSRSSAPSSSSRCWAFRSTCSPCSVSSWPSASSSTMRLSWLRR